MKFNYNFKTKSAQVEADVEKLIEKGLDNHEKDWQEKFNTKHIAKKEMLQLKHQQKLELKEINSKHQNKYQIELEEKIRKENIKKTDEQQKSKKIIRNISIILTFVFGLFLIVSFQNKNVIASIIGIIQISLLIFSILMCEDIFHVFKKDYKILFIASIFLIIAWLGFAV